MNETKTRTVTGAIFGAVVIGAVLLSPWTNALLWTCGGRAGLARDAPRHAIEALGLAHCIRRCSGWLGLRDVPIGLGCIRNACARPGFGLIDFDLVQ